MTAFHEQYLQHGHFRSLPDTEYELFGAKGVALINPPPRTGRSIGDVCDEEKMRMMSRRSLIRSLAFIVPVLGVVACGGPVDTDKFALFFTPYRFRLAVTVDTPAGPRVGSGVIEVKWSYSSFKTTGEAVPIDLPNGETLFILLQSRGDVDWASKSVNWIPEELRKSWAMPQSDDGPSSSERGKHFWQNVAAFRGTVQVPRTRKLNAKTTDFVDNYPLIIRFGDANDPSTVEEINPDAFGATIGPGYSLRSLSATFTDEPISTGIRKRLPWLDDYRRRNARLSGSSSIAIETNGLADNLETGSFRTGFKE